MGLILMLWHRKAIGRMSGHVHSLSGTGLELILRNVQGSPLNGYTKMCIQTRNKPSSDDELAFDLILDLQLLELREIGLSK